MLTQDFPADGDAFSVAPQGRSSEQVYHWEKKIQPVQPAGLLYVYSFIFISTAFSQTFKHDSYEFDLEFRPKVTFFSEWHNC